MCLIASGGFAHFAEHVCWLMGYETLCYALYDQRDLVKAISERLIEIYTVVLERILQFDRVKIVWGSDDMGFKTGTLISPADLREFVLPGHKLMAEMAHAAGRPYLLHSCGKLTEIMDDLIDDVKIDAKHSFEDTIEPVTDANERYGRAHRHAGRHRRGFPLPLQRRSRSASACATRSSLHARRRLLPRHAATPSPTTSRWTTTWRCWTRGAGTPWAGERVAPLQGAWLLADGFLGFVRPPSGGQPAPQAVY